MPDHKDVEKTRPGTPKSGRLGEILRELRGARTLRDVADGLNIDYSWLGKVERGEKVPSAEKLAQLLTYYGVVGDRYEEIMGMLQGIDEPQWLAVTPPEQREHQAARIALEEQAEKVVECAPSLVPGWLQIRDYARAVMMTGGVPVSEIGTRVAIRMGRRDVLMGPNPPHLLALLDEAVLHHNFGGPEVMAAQMDFLVEMAKRPGIDVRVVPFGQSCSQGLEAPFTLIEPRKSEGSFPVVDIGGRTAGLIFHAPEVVEAYRQAAKAVLRVAMSSTDSISHIVTLAKEKRTG